MISSCPVKLREVAYCFAALAQNFTLLGTEYVFNKGQTHKVIELKTLTP